MKTIQSYSHKKNTWVKDMLFKLSRPERKEFEMLLLNSAHIVRPFIATMVNERDDERYSTKIIKFYRKLELGAFFKLLYAFYNNFTQEAQ